jgi:hypothetical protein
MGRACTRFGHPECLFDLEELVVSADHELGRDRGAVGAGAQAGDVALDPGQRPGLVHQCAVHAPGAARKLDEPVPLDRNLASDSLLSLLDLLVDPAQRLRGERGPGGVGGLGPPVCCGEPAGGGPPVPLHGAAAGAAEACAADSARPDQNA